MSFELELMSREVALRINAHLSKKGIPTEHRVLIAVKAQQEVKVGSLYVPQDADNIPKKGVVIQIGPIDEDHQTYQRDLDVGSIVNYGLYAGKELDLDIPKELIEGYQVTVLSLNEILYIETNK